MSDPALQSTASAPVHGAWSAPGQQPEVGFLKRVAWVIYLVTVYPLLAYEVYSDPARYVSADGTFGTDLARVAFTFALWAGLCQASIRLPAHRRGEQQAVKQYGDSSKPATMLISWVHSSVSVAAGLWLMLPDMLAGTWEWDKPMDDSTATFISIFVGYQLCDTALGWDGLSWQHRVHHFAGLVAWGFPLAARTPKMIVPLAYLMAEAPNPFLHARWLFRHWGVDNTLSRLNEYIFVVAWILCRNVPELLACWYHAWFDQGFPLAWRLTVFVGNMLTVAWTAMVVRMINKKLCRKKSREA